MPQNVRCNMANSEIIGAGQDTVHRAPKDIRVLAACEESQAVATAFRRLGFAAFSCDIEPCSGGHPEWHIQQDAIPLLSQQWDLVIAFPPCDEFLPVCHCAILSRHERRLRILSRLYPSWLMNAPPRHPQDRMHSAPGSIGEAPMRP